MASLTSKYSCTGREFGCALKFLLLGHGEPVSSGAGLPGILPHEAADVAALTPAVISLGSLGLTWGEIDFGLERECDAFAGEVDFHHGRLYLLAGFEEVGGIFDKLVADLADMDEAVLMDPYIDEGSEGGDIRHDARELEARLEILHFLDSLGKAEGLELLSRIAARLR